MAQVNPDVYDSTISGHRPMVPGTDQINPVLLPLSARSGNSIINLGDGLYSGNFLALPAYYVNSSTGVDAPGQGTRALPFASLDYALSQLTAQSISNQYRAHGITIALQAGQSFTMNSDFNLYGGSLSIAFYGDTQYGDFNGAAVGSGAKPAWMTDLARPTITFATANSNSQWRMAGFNRSGGFLSFVGVTLQLPFAPAQPSITLYSQAVDVVRNMNYDERGYVVLEGSIVNMQDTTAYWGFLGTWARSTGCTFTQLASEFTINNRQISANVAPAPTSAELLARQYFLKMYTDVPGNNTVGVLSGTTQNSTAGSGILNLTWADTEGLVVSTGKTNLQSFPVNFDLNYGLRNYIFGLQKDQQSRPTNILTSRLF